MLIILLLVMNACKEQQDHSKHAHHEHHKMESGKVSGESVYNLEGKSLKNQNAEAISLSDFKNSKVLVSMIFSTCKDICPRLVADMQNIERKLEKDSIQDVKYVLISFDSDKDTPNVLKEYAVKMKFDLKRWTLIHASASDIAEIAAVLGVKYKKMEDGTFSHSNLISLLNAKGEIVYRLEGLGQNPDALIEKLKSL